MSSPLGSVRAGLSAAGTTNANATSLVAGASLYQISTCVAAAGVILPASQANGVTFVIRNDGAGYCNCYPNSGGAINGMTADLPFIIAAGGQATLSAAGGLTWYTSNVQGTPIIPKAATGTLEVNESGAILVVNQTAASVLTLPAVTNIGLKYKFVIGTSAANTCTIRAATAVQNGTLAIMIAAGAVGVLASNHTDIIFAASNLVGSWLEVTSNGTQWMVSGASKLVGGFTVL